MSTGVGGVFFGEEGLEGFAGFGFGEEWCVADVGYFDETGVGVGLEHVLGDLGGEDVALGAAEDEDGALDGAVGVPWWDCCGFGRGGADGWVHFPYVDAGVGSADVVAGEFGELVVAEVGDHGGVVFAVVADDGFDVGEHFGCVLDVGDDALEAFGVDFGADVVEGDAGDVLGVAGGVVHGDEAAHGGADDGEALEAEGLADGFEVLDVGVDVVLVGGAPFAFAAAADVEAVDVVVGGEDVGDAVEGVGLAGEAVDHDDDGGAGCAAGEEVMAESVGLDEDVADGVDGGHGWDSGWAVAGLVLAGL